jgi:hypothetical protein
MEEFDPIEQIRKMTKLRELNGHYYFIPELHKERNVTEEIGLGILYFKRTFEKILNYLPIISIVLFCFILLFILTYCLIKHHTKICCKEKIRRRNQSEIKLTELQPNRPTSEEEVVKLIRAKIELTELEEEVTP